MQTIDPAATALVLISSALVFLMTPGLAFFYGGLVRRKNVLSIMMQSFISMGIVTIIWVGEKRGDALFVRGQEYAAHHESDSTE